MIGNINKGLLGILFLLLTQCGEVKERDKSSEKTVETVESDTVEVPTSCDQDHLETCSYMDSDLCEGGVCLVCKDPENHEKIIAKSGDLEYEILNYEGLLISAYSIEGGKRLIFEPFDYYDYDLEMEVKSTFTENLEIDISPSQNQYLGFIKSNSATNNLKWDYHENLFTVYYFVNTEGEKVPLNFVDHGKQEWDG